MPPTPINTDFTRFVENLTSKGASDSETVHAQNIAAAIMRVKPAASLSCEVEKSSIQLSFTLAIPDAAALAIDTIIAEVSKSVNCVASGSIRFLTNDPAAVISVVLQRGDVILRDRDPVGVGTVFRNKVNNIMSDAGLEGRQLAAAQMVQKYMINVHEMQPLTKFAVVVDPPPLVVVVSELDVVSLFWLNELKKAAPDIESISVAASRATTLSPPKYELHFAIKDNAESAPALPSRKRSLSLFSLFSSNK